MILARGLGFNTEPFRRDNDGLCGRVRLLLQAFRCYVVDFGKYFSVSILVFDKLPSGSSLRSFVVMNYYSSRIDIHGCPGETALPPFDLHLLPIAGSNFQVNERAGSTYNFARQ